MKKSLLALSILLSTSAMADYKIFIKEGKIKLPEKNEVTSNFTSHTFTNCGQTGRFGPSQSQCSSVYNGTEILSPELSFSVTNGIQSWTIPITGNYIIEALGAQGGSVGGYTGGLGAKAEKTVSLNSGDVIKVLVGQVGTAAENGAGGGGGSYVVLGNTPLVIAGGGGGAHSRSDRGARNGYPGKGTESGGNSSVTTGTCNSTGTGGVSGNSGGGGCAGGGAGWLDNGGNGAQGTHAGLGGLNFFSGGIGGDSISPNGKPYGGFGGGGAGSPRSGYGGGGGGYSGGGGGNYNSQFNRAGVGGGGGSLGDNNANNFNSGHGSVTITLVE